MEITKDYLDQQFERQFELTKEHFERSFNHQFEQIKEHLGQELDQRLKAQTKELKGYIHDSFEVQQVYIDERFSELIDNTHLKTKTF